MEQKEQADVLRERGRILAEEILEDARKKAARILKKSEKDAAAVGKKATAECERLTDEIGREAADRAAIESNKIRAGAGLECKRLRLARISAFLEEIAEDGLSGMESLSGPDADALLKKLLESALQRVETGRATLFLAEGVETASIEKKVDSVLPDLELIIDHDSSLHPAEFILKEEDGRISFPAVFRRMYALDRDHCLRALYSSLFGGDA